MVRSRRARLLSIVAIMIVASVSFFWYVNQPNRDAANAASSVPTELEATEESSAETLTMSEVLDMAADVRRNMAQTLDDYTADFIKQELDTSGNLSGVSEISMKVQTRVRGDRDDAPMRVYLRFNAPEKVNGREVLWAEDMNNGKLAVHEVGLLLGLKIIWLDPEGPLAMQGQRYPIGEIGLVKLTEKLIERGEKDRNNADISVSVGTDPNDETGMLQLIQIRRAKPSGEEDDFSLAEVVFDTERELILGYRSFGWPEEAEGVPPLLESYRYQNVKTNVGLTEKDFQTDNEEYAFPAF